MFNDKKKARKATNAPESSASRKQHGVKRPNRRLRPQSHFPREYIEGKAVLSASAGEKTKLQSKEPLWGLSQFVFDEINAFRKITRSGRGKCDWMGIERWKSLTYEQRREIYQVFERYHSKDMHYLDFLDSHVHEEIQSSHELTKSEQTKSTITEAKKAGDMAKAEVSLIENSYKPGHVRPVAPDMYKPVPHNLAYDSEIRLRAFAARSGINPPIEYVFKPDGSAEAVLSPASSPQSCIATTNNSEQDPSALELSPEIGKAGVIEADGWFEGSLQERAQIYKPRGRKQPEKSKKTTTTQFERDSEVKTWVLATSRGFCECCGKPAPFVTADFRPYLEVHHVRRLADGGADTITNTVALCPNCHREIHLGFNGESLVQRLYENLKRLVKE